MIESAVREVREEVQWRACVDAHQARLAPLVHPHLHRRDRGEKHPLMDFLFEYFTFRPALLMRWSPGAEVLLRGNVSEFLMRAHVRQQEGGALISATSIPEKRRSTLNWVTGLLQKIQSRPCSYNCFNLHEWAMVYEKKDVRHPQLGLRLGHARSRQVVRSLPVQCSHYDAFRFFSKSAMPLNVLQPCAESRYADEQGGCLHVIMDLYKWAYKFYPWVSSDLIADAFLLAVEARTLDMRASPYNVAPFELSPICIETSQGREQFVREQKALSEKAQVLRLRLIDVFQCLLKMSSD